MDDLRMTDLNGLLVEWMTFWLNEQFAHEGKWVVPKNVCNGMSLHNFQNQSYIKPKKQIFYYTPKLLAV